MRAFKSLLLVMLTAWGTTAPGAPTKRQPYIGYVFPGGGRQGTVFEVTAGGQFLRGADKVHISGEGVHAAVVKYYRPARNINGDQRKELQKRLSELANKRLAEMPAKDRPPIPFLLKIRARTNLRKGRPAKDAAKPKGTGKEKAAEKKPVKLPDHPLLRNLENKSLKELVHVADELLNYRKRKKRQRNSQLADVVLIEVTVDRDAPLGDRELRIETPLGLTNPMCFQVGSLPEVREREPNDPGSFPFLPKDPPVELPVLFNGQIMPGDIDRFRFRAAKGQQLVIETQARYLVPFLADAVPGWFQATVALYDAKGNEVAFADDYRFDPDPVLFYRIPQDGEYELEIHDSIYRGREDFVYRIAVGQLPFITGMFPLGGRSGYKTRAAIDGWNLPAKMLRLDTSSGDPSIRQTALSRNKLISNKVTYAVDTLPECKETEPNNNIKNAQRIKLPRIVNGRIDRPGDVDVFRFHGRAGDDVVAEVLARRLYSPVDSLLRLTDASGRVLQWNDDYVRKEGYLHEDVGILTHQADSYLTARLPKTGTYFVHVTDAENHGGAPYGYRLRVTPPRADFELCVSPSSLSVGAGRLVPITVYVLRKDGFKGDVEVALKNAPVGFALSGGRIPGGRDHIRMTLSTPRKPLDRPVVLQMEGRADINGETVSRRVVPTDNVMQAFLYRHLVPSRELMVAVKKQRWGLPPIQVANGLPVRVPEGGTAQVRLKTHRRPGRRQLTLEINEPTKGVSIRDARLLPDGLAFQVKVEGDALKAGFADNLIIEAFVNIQPKKGKQETGKTAKQKPRRMRKQKRRFSLGILPAIPFVVVKP